jgi:hypothetical protein
MRVCVGSSGACSVGRTNSDLSSLSAYTLCDATPHPDVDRASFDCHQLAPGARGGLSGSALASCLPPLDAAKIGDSVTCTALSIE